MRISPNEALSPSLSGVIPDVVLLPALAAILLVLALKMWRLAHVCAAR
jgi:hypothetical protein